MSVTKFQPKEVDVEKECAEIKERLEKLLPELYGIRKDDYGVLQYTLIVLEVIENCGVKY